MTLNERLTFLRDRQRLTQEQLAEKLGVSRQAVAKWESGVSQPDIDKLLALATLYSISVDALLRDNGYPLPDAKPLLPQDETLCRFLLKARQRGYAAKAEHAAPCRTASLDYYVEDAEVGLTYLDSYFGADPFGGEEVVWKGGVAIWCMNYYGRLLSHEVGYDFLREAMLRAPEELPLRGPAYYAAGGYAYVCKTQGDLGFFSGEEQIYRAEDQALVYEGFFHGGSLRA